MNNLGKLAGQAGSLAGFVGLLICLWAGAGRFIEDVTVQGFQAINVFMVGVGFMVTACWLKLEARSKS